MKFFSKVAAGFGALVLTVGLMALPDLSMAQVPHAHAHYSLVHHLVACR